MGGGGYVQDGLISAMSDGHSVVFGSSVRRLAMYRRIALDLYKMAQKCIPFGHI